jgi:hypothetical protein
MNTQKSSSWFLFCDILACEKCRLDFEKQEKTSLSANHLQKLRLSFELTSPSGSSFKPQQVFLYLENFGFSFKSFQLYQFSMLYHVIVYGGNLCLLWAGLLETSAWDPCGASLSCQIFWKGLWTHSGMSYTSCKTSKIAKLSSELGYWNIISLFVNVSAG